MRAELNPIVVRELRGGLRSGRRVALLTFFLLIVGAFLLGVFAAAAATLEQGDFSAQSAALGAAFFPLIVGVELFFVCLVAPAQTAGALTSERERQTYDGLLVTPLTPWRIVLGKLVAGLAYTCLLLVAAVPLQSMAFLMGGVGPEELLLALLLLFMTMLVFGCLGLWSSARFRTTRSAGSFAYVLTGALTLGIPVASAFSRPFLYAVTQAHPELAAAPPPWLIYAGELLSATNPWITAGLTLAQLQSASSLFWLHQTFGKTAVGLPGPWLVFTAVYVLLAALLLWRTTRLVQRRRG